MHNSIISRCVRKWFWIRICIWISKFNKITLFLPEFYVLNQNPLEKLLLSLHAHMPTLNVQINLLNMSLLLLGVLRSHFAWNLRPYLQFCAISHTKCENGHNGINNSHDCWYFLISHKACLVCLSLFNFLSSFLLFQFHLKLSFGFLTHFPDNSFWQLTWYLFPKWFFLVLGFS